MSWKRRGAVAGVVIGGAAAVALGLVAVYVLVFNVYEAGGVTTIEVRPVTLVKPDQGWTPAVARAYWHQSQGAKILPLAWFRALEQPVFTPLPAGRFGAREYLERFGFLYDDARTADELPIGFAVEHDFVAPYAVPPIATPTPVVGLTCAACHTGRLDVPDRDGRLKGFLVEGGSAVINLPLFQDAAGYALYYTQFFAARFNRFAARVLNADLPDGDARKERLRRDLRTFIATGQAAKDYRKDHKLEPVEPGYARTDALGLIGNRVFGVLGPENQVVTDAPVNFPHLWDTAWFDWVQYNGSIRMPMARNIGEALGVGALVNLDPNQGPLYDSTVNVAGLDRLESWLGGNNPFEGLRPPKWDADLLGPIRPAFAARGAALYRAHCMHCHLPPRDELKADLASASPRHFVTDSWAGKRFLHLEVIDLYEIGTDPNQALNFYRRVAVMNKPADGKKSEQTEAEHRDTIAAKVGLFLITSFIRRDKYQSPALGLLNPGTPATVKDLERLKKFDRFRKVDDALVVGDVGALLAYAGIDTVILAPLGYKARPLDGVWATPPFLHNGSVPSLYQLLLPAARRDRVFYLGTKRFDPEHVGYQTHQTRGASRIDTSQAGNRNSGHEFRNMALEELETAQGLTPQNTEAQDVRWARVLAVSPDEYAKLSPATRWDRVRQASRAARKLRHYVPARGVLGMEFSEDERWQLVEYLKTL